MSYSARPGATSLAHVIMSVVFLELKQHNLNIASQVWARVALLVSSVVSRLRFSSCWLNGPENSFLAL